MKTWAIILSVLASILILTGFGFSDVFATHKVNHNPGGGGGEDVIDQIWAAINDLIERVTTLENSQTLALLSCTTDQVARWTGTEWRCSTVSIGGGPITVDTVGHVGEYSSLGEDQYTIAHGLVDAILWTNRSLGTSIQDVLYTPVMKRAA